MDLLTLKNNLISLGYKAEVFENAKDATEYLKGCIKGTTVAIGGCITAKEMGLGEALSEENELIWHWFPREDKSANDELIAATDTEIYISSVNGISQSGEIVNIDGTCNRLASTLYGHKKVYLVVGKNKVRDTLEAAISRARNIAAPLNARRLNKNTPCAIGSGEVRCYDCSSPERICAALTVFWKKPKGMEYEVILINEDLGY